VKRVDDSFKDRVYELVNSIPAGRVMTYGQIALLCGAAWAAWEVGQIAHMGPANLPWHRVVNKSGGLASGYTHGGKEGQRTELVNEGVKVTQDFYVNIDELLWNPGTTTTK
jgi:methylated-DNA-protein-cysteine methyltransferase-like protein